MTVKGRYLIILFLLSCMQLSAQDISFKDTVAAYNLHRIRTNKKGMEVLGAWGIANVAGGAVGFFTAKQDEWRDFHAMNALWGLTNTGIAAFGLYGTRREAAIHPNASGAYQRYLANKRIYLINAGLDLLYIGSGVALTELGAQSNRNAAVLKGFGASFAMQGVFLLLFDNIMFASHQGYNSRWFRLMNEIHISGSSVGIYHTF
jgi:hypothetical protein